MTDLLITRGALVVGPYRYVLTRDLNCAGRSAAIVMVNPSTADAEEDDQTIRKLYGFASRNGISRFAVVNKFAFRATDIDELRGITDPVGPENDLWIEKTIADSEMCILAWGRLGKLPPELRRRWRNVVAIVAKVGRPALCLGTTDDRQPIHPLTVGYGNALRSWEPPA